MARCTGTRSLRVEDSRLLTGTGTYIDDAVRRGRLHACFVRSAVAWARTAGTDGSEALQLDGALAVLVAHDLKPGVREQWYALDGRYDPDTPRRPSPGVRCGPSATRWRWSSLSTAPDAGRPTGDLAPFFDGAPRVVSATAHRQAHSPVPMETRGIGAEWSAHSSPRPSPHSPCRSSPHSSCAPTGDSARCSVITS